MAVPQKIDRTGIDGGREDRFEKKLEACLEIVLGTEEIDRQNEGDHRFKNTLGQVDRGVDNVVQALGEQ